MGLKHIVHGTLWDIPSVSLTLVYIKGVLKFLWTVEDNAEQHSSGVASLNPNIFSRHGTFIRDL